MRDVLVTGSTGTIGSTVAEELTLRGYLVSKPGRDFAWTPEDPYALVVCHGDYGPEELLYYVERDDWNNCIKTNLLDVVDQVRKFVRFMGKKPGRIVLMGGAAIGSGKHLPLRSAYVTAKGALHYFVEAMAHELPNIQINIVAPGPVKSAMTSNELGVDWVSPSLAAAITGDLLDGKWGATTGRIISARKKQSFVLRSTS